MDSLKTLLVKGEYDLVLDLTKHSENPDELLIRIAAYTAKGNLEEALKTLELNKEELYIHYPARTIKNHFGLLKEIGDFLKLKQVYEEYSNKPYISQEVEEILREGNSFIENALDNKKPVSNTISSDEILKGIYDSTNPLKLQDYLNKINDTNIEFLYPQLKHYLSEKRIKRMRLQVLFCLMKFGKDEEVEFSEGKNIYRINLLKDNPPFMMKEYQTLEENIFKFSKNITISSIAVQILGDYFLSMYPKHEIKDEGKFLLALLRLAKDYLKDESKLELNFTLKANDQDIKKIQKSILTTLGKLDK